MSYSDEEHCGGFGSERYRIDSPVETSDYHSYSMYSMDDEDHGATGIFSGSEVEDDGGGQGEDPDEDDVYSQLAQKDKDLILAAELGKALLERNEELSRKHEQLQQEYTERLETLEQERYEMKLRLETIEGQCEGRMMDVQGELMRLQKELEERQETLRAGEKEKQHVVRELSEQNHRLSSQLQQATSTESELVDQIQKLQLQLNDKKSSMHDNTHLLERLREEVQLLTDRKCELERRLNALVEERESLACSLEESNDRTMMLERKVREAEQQLYSKDCELNELRDMNSQLMERVEELSAQSLHQTTDSPSLFEELGESQMALYTSDVEMEPRHGRYSIDDIESDEEEVDESNAMVTSRPHSVGGLDFETEQLRAINEEMKVMIQQSYSKLSDILQDLRQQLCITKRDDDESRERMLPEKIDEKEEDEEDEDEDEDCFQSENLKNVIDEIKKAVQDTVQQQLSLSNATSVSNASLKQTKGQLGKLEGKIQDLEDELQSTQDHMGVLQTEIGKLGEDLQEKTNNIEVLNSKARQSVAGNSSPVQLHDRERQVEVLQEERLQVERHHQDDMIRNEEAIQKAKMERDEAVAKKNSAELELTRAKIDLMNLDSQLLEAIQQKIELSQQLDQWQLDMESLLGIRMKKKLDEDESNSTVVTPVTRRKKLTFWS